MSSTGELINVSGGFHTPSRYSDLLRTIVVIADVKLTHCAEEKLTHLE